MNAFPAIHVLTLQLYLSKLLKRIPNLVELHKAFFSATCKLSFDKCGHKDDDWFSSNLGFYASTASHHIMLTYKVQLY